MHKLVVVIFMLLVFCFSPILGSAGESQPNRKAEWEKTVAAAKKEGQVNVYISCWQPVLDAGVFQKRFPEIKVVGVSGRGPQLMNRILAERRAGKYLTDVTSAGTNPNHRVYYREGFLRPIKPALLLPDVLDESQWWKGRHLYVDPEEEYVFRYVGSPQIGGAHYNTNLVNPDEFKSFWDFLKLKWKGKILARDVRYPGPGGGATRFFYHNPQIGPEFLRRLFSEMNITLSRNRRQMVDWLGVGKFAICFFCSGVDQAKRQGLPVDSFGIMKEGAGLVVQCGTLGLMKDAPHPNAAKVFINWFLSREGQATLQRSLSEAGDSVPDSLRVDIPKDYVAPGNRRMDGVEYLELDIPGRLEMKPVYKVLREAMSEAKKRKDKSR